MPIVGHSYQCQRNDKCEECSGKHEKPAYHQMIRTVSERQCSHYDQGYRSRATGRKCEYDADPKQPSYCFYHSLSTSLILSGAMLRSISPGTRRSNRGIVWVL